MKKILSTIVIVFLSVSLYAQGQMAALIHQNVNVFECGSLHYKDGRVEEYKYVSIPRANMTSIAVSNESKTKGIKEIDVDELVSVTIWHENFPENKTTLYHVVADKYALIPTNVWGIPIASSKWGTLYQCYVTYTMYVDCGDLEGDLYIVDGAPNPVHCYLQCRDCEKAQVISYIQYQVYGFANGHHKTKEGKKGWTRAAKKVAEIFASHPDVAEKIKKKELQAADIQQILDEMAK